MKKFKERIITTPNGETFLMLLNSETGIPDINSTLYILTQIRSQGKAAATIRYTLQNISFFKLLLQKYDMSEELLLKRFDEGKVLHQFELEGLIEDCKYKVEDIVNDILENEKNELPFMKNISLKSLEKFRSKNLYYDRKYVHKSTAANRLRTIRSYVIWLANVNLSRLDINSIEYLSLKENIKEFKERIESRIPKKSIAYDPKEGLSKDELDTLLNLVKRNSPHNPFRGEFLKSRNEVIFSWLIQFGLRKGELLNIKISDIDFRKKEVQIVRRADDIADTRTNKPNVKTNGRKLAIPDKILEITEHYIIDHRSKLRGAKKHEFLIVSSNDGAPISLEGIAVIFRRLRKAFPQLPEDFSAHILRHTWNDNFSKLMDEKKNVSEDREQQLRNYFNGWKDGSKSAQNYTRRHVREEANKTLNELADNLFKKEDKL